jgi:MAP/microtubule affinity-regulating kinase
LTNIPPIATPPNGKLSNVVPLPDINSPFKRAVPIPIIKEEMKEDVTDNQVSPSKFGIGRRNTQKPIPLDTTLYIKEDEEESNSVNPRTIKFAFNCTSHVKISPGILFERLSNILDKNDVIWYNDDFLCSCEWGDIKFEVEICKLPRLQSYGIRIKRYNGDIWEFKKLSSKITQELETSM